MEVTLKRIESGEDFCLGCIFLQFDSTFCEDITKIFPCEENDIEYIWVKDEDQD